MTQSIAPQHLVTRFAPSPTGRLHVGHGWSALMAMDLARETGGRFHLRVEDIDGTRSRPAHVAGIIDDLHWLGIEWDGEIVFQSRRLSAYNAALDQLRTMGLLYPCFCTRADIQASLAAPHGPEGPIYPGTCRMLAQSERERRIAASEPHAWRIDIEAAQVQAGQTSWSALPYPFAPGGMAADVLAAPTLAGDVVLARKDAPASYHLSCTLDDAAMGITHVLRGNDLRAATDIHRLLQALLGLPSPAYIHHPLLLSADGKRLAKRDGAIALAELRAAGMEPRRLADDLRAGRFPVGIATGPA